MCVTIRFGDTSRTLPWRALMSPIVEEIASDYSGKLKVEMRKGRMIVKMSDKILFDLPGRGLLAPGQSGYRFFRLRFPIQTVAGDRLPDGKEIAFLADRVMFTLGAVPERLAWGTGYLNRPSTGRDWRCRGSAGVGLRHAP